MEREWIERHAGNDCYYWETRGADGLYGITFSAKDGRWVMFATAWQGNGNIRPLQTTTDVQDAMSEAEQYIA